nr:DUF1093 domain-containing protein [Shouchella patagoniensis]
MKEGDEIIVEFSSANELRTDAYLMLYVRHEDDVTSYKRARLSLKRITQIRKI